MGMYARRLAGALIGNAVDAVEFLDEEFVRGVLDPACHARCSDHQRHCHAGKQRTPALFEGFLLSPELSECALKGLIDPG